MFTTATKDKYLKKTSVHNQQILLDCKYAYATWIIITRSLSVRMLSLLAYKFSNTCLTPYSIKLNVNSSGHRQQSFDR